MLKYANGQLVEMTQGEIDAITLSQGELIAQLQSDITSRAQQRLDAFARTRMYDDIKSLCDYAGDEDPQFAAEGAYGRQVRSRTWRTLITIMEQVQAGTRPMPANYEEIESELPVLAWPV